MSAAPATEPQQPTQHARAKRRLWTVRKAAPEGTSWRLKVLAALARADNARSRTATSDTDAGAP